VAQILIDAMAENVDPRALASPGDGE